MCLIVSKGIFPHTWVLDHICTKWTWGNPPVASLDKLSLMTFPWLCYIPTLMLAIDTSQQFPSLLSRHKLRSIFPSRNNLSRRDVKPSVKLDEWQPKSVWLQVEVEISSWHLLLSVPDQKPRWHVASLKHALHRIELCKLTYICCAACIIKEECRTCIQFYTRHIEE